MPGKEFHSPYNFIPVTGKIGDQKNPKTPYADIKDGKDLYVRHDLWRKDAKHGRILCHLHLHTPTVAGGVHDPRQEGRAQDVNPYCVNGNPAIPGKQPARDDWLGGGNAEPVGTEGVGG